MNNTAAIKVKARRVNAYLTKDVLDATPEKLLLKVYDFAIANSKRKNLGKTNKALSELINALNFEKEETKEFSLGLMSLYQFCQERMRKGDNEIVSRILTDLRDSWTDIFKNRPSAA